jgi:hypothetical protein
MYTGINNDSTGFVMHFIRIPTIWLEPIIPAIQDRYFHALETANTRYHKFFA